MNGESESWTEIDGEDGEGKEGARYNEGTMSTASCWRLVGF